MDGLICLCCAQVRTAFSKAGLIAPSPTQAHYSACPNHPHGAPHSPHGGKITKTAPPLQSAITLTAMIPTARLRPATTTSSCDPALMDIVRKSWCPDFAPCRCLLPRTLADATRCASPMIDTIMCPADMNKCGISKINAFLMKLTVGETSPSGAWALQVVT